MVASERTLPVSVLCAPHCVLAGTQCVMREFPETRLAFGESDEYSFVLHKDTQLYGACGEWRPRARRPQPQQHSVCASARAPTRTPAVVSLHACGLVSPPPACRTARQQAHIHVCQLLHGQLRAAVAAVPAAAAAAVHARV
jgi:hypothetical protein